MGQMTVVPMHMGTLHRLAQSLPFFVDWSLPQLKSIVPSCASVRVAEPVFLQRRQGLEPFTYFLLRGAVHLTDSEGSERIIKAGDLDAGFPIAQLRPGSCDLLAQPGAELLRIESSRLRVQQAQRKPVLRLTQTEANDAGWRAHPLVQRLVQQANAGALTLPALPGITLRLRQILDRKDFRWDEVLAIVAADPAIVARLLKVANSVVFAGHGHCDSVKTALARLGTAKVQQIVLSLVARDLFAAKHPTLKSLMIRRWHHAVEIASISAVLARMTPGLQSDRALLVGLLHEIGVLPILRMAESFPDLLEDQQQLLGLLDQLTPELSAQIMAHWQFDSVFQDAALNQNNWFRSHEGEADYTDVLLIAHLHAQVRERAQRQLPRIDETPAFEKLAMGKLTPNLSLFVLEEAHAHIDELKSLLI